MKEITLTKGKVAIVDDEDFERLNVFKWHLHNRYAARTSSTKDGKRHQINMHREIIQTPRGMETDHINGNGLDNRKCNLRVCTKSQNMMNRGKLSHNKSGFKGVAWYKATNKWMAQIRLQGKAIYLGYFDTKEAAYEAYCEACVKYHGEFGFKAVREVIGE